VRGSAWLAISYRSKNLSILEANWPEMNKILGVGKPWFGVNPLPFHFLKYKEKRQRVRPVK